MENELSQFSKGGVTLAGCVETLEVDFKNKSQEVESERKSDEKKCKVRFSLMKKNKAFKKK